MTIFATLVGRAHGWVTPAAIAAPRREVGLIYSPDKWSVLVAVIVASAGVFSLASARLGGLLGVFTTVTTIPAAANIAMGEAFGL